MNSNYQNLRYRIGRCGMGQTRPALPIGQCWLDYSRLLRPNARLPGVKRYGYHEFRFYASAYWNITISKEQLMDLTVKEIRRHNLEKLIKETGMSKGKFAIRIETAPAYISQILSKNSKRGMGDFMARKIELKLGKPKGWMDCWHDDEPPVSKQQMQNDFQTGDENFGFFDIWDGSTPLPDDETLLDFYTPSHSLDVLRKIDVQDSPQLKLRFSKAILKTMGIQESKALCVTVCGNSMTPVLPEGTTLGFDTSKTTIVDGDIYAIDHAGSLRVKIIYRLPGGGLRLRSFNSAEWPDESISLEECGRIKILGRVFWWSVLR